MKYVKQKTKDMKEDVNKEEMVVVSKELFSLLEKFLTSWIAFKTNDATELDQDQSLETSIDDYIAIQQQLARLPKKIYWIGMAKLSLKFLHENCEPFCSESILIESFAALEKDERSTQEVLSMIAPEDVEKVMQLKQTVKR